MYLGQSSKVLGKKTARTYACKLNKCDQFKCGFTKQDDYNFIQAAKEAKHFRSQTHLQINLQTLRRKLHHNPPENKR